MLVKDLLQTGVETLSEQATIGEAAKFFLRTGMIDVPVCDVEDSFLGVLSQGDLLRAAMPDVEQIYSSKVSYHGLNEYFLSSAHEKTNIKISRYIIREPYTLLPEDSIVKAVTIMINHRIGSLPVLHNKKLLGILTRKDTLNLFVSSVKDDNSL